ncbi:MAG: methionine--tRNA ligase [Thermoplasmatota archaeon]
MSRPVYIGVAWPYANGGLHLGHVAGSLLPPDIFRRAMRMQGRDVLMVSGSDCHGTPILLKAEAEGRTPQDVVEMFNADHTDALRRLDIGFDLFTRTTTDNHIATVQEIFLACQEMGYIEIRTQQAPFDTKAGRFLPDRYVEGTCPHCDTPGARGDQCDACGKTLDPQELKDPVSKLNPGSPIEFRDTDHFFFLLSKLQPKLERYVAENAGHWRANTVNFTKNWLSEGLQDRAITRDLTWGIPIPLEGYDDKRIYVWFEAVCGYLSAAKEWAQRGSGAGFEDLPKGASNAGIAGAALPQDDRGFEHYWTDPESQGYYFLGKDNIPFHTIIWPGILIAYNEWRAKHGKPLLNLPYDVPANEFLNLDGKQFSKSRGISIGVHDVLDRFQADAVRYYLSVNMPEQRDSDWTWDDFLSKVNDELVGTMGNLVHRVLSFTQKNLGAIPSASPTELDAKVTDAIEACGKDMAGLLANVQLKKAVRRLLEFAGWGNQTMQETAPWKLLKEDREAGEAALYSLLRVVKALAVYMAPYMPSAAQQAWQMLGESGSVHDAAWSDAGKPLQSGHQLELPKALFAKLDPKSIPGAEAEEKPAKKEQPKQKKADAKPADDGTVDFDTFSKVQLRIAKIASVDEHPKADKLYVLKLDVGGDERQVVAGLKAYYTPEELLGQTVAFVANLAPVKLRGVESQGMILAADHDGVVSVLNPQRDMPAGAQIR